MIDRLREQIQHRLDQFAGEADKLRKALAALDPRSSSAPTARKAPARARARTTAPEPKAPATKSAPARRTRQPAAPSPGRTAPGATKASVLAALAGGEAMTAGQVADKTGLARATVSTTLSKLSKIGKVQKAERGYRLAAAAPRRPLRRRSSPAARRPRGRRYCAVVLPLGFRFDVDAVLVGGVAHRQDCDRLPRALPHDAVSVSAGEAHRAQRCPRECPECQPPFETLLTYQLERSVEALVPG